MVQQCMDREAANGAAGGRDAAQASALHAWEDAERRLAANPKGTPGHEEAQRNYRRASSRHTAAGKPQQHRGAVCGPEQPRTGRPGADWRYGSV
jgi:hypothetical protein